jgi:hypothetical protein
VDGDLAVMMRRSSLLSVAVLSLAACGNRGSSSGAGASSGSAAPAPPAVATVVPREDGVAAVTPENPLGLPPAKVALEAGKRVFTFTGPMMASARPGATLVLAPATVVGLEGDDLIVDSHGGASYKVHPGYVIAVPDAPRLRPGDAVLTEHAGRMVHAVVTRFVKDRVGVRLTGLDARAAEITLPGGSGAPTPAGPSKAARFVKQAEGLAPGNYAALRQGGEWLHVLLVSASGEGEARRWFALGYGGAAVLVAEADLTAIPVRYAPKLHALVSAESGGKMRRATVLAADEQGIFVVKFERAGKPSVVGWGALTAPLPAPVAAADE